MMEIFVHIGVIYDWLCEEGSIQELTEGVTSGHKGDDPLDRWHVKTIIA